MEFSKKQIVSKSFSKKWTRGLNELEVRDYLHILAEQIRHLKQENLLLTKDLQDKESLIKDYRDREHILKESIANAENWAQKIKQDAESYRRLILEKAQTDSESLIESARKSLQSVYNDIADLKRLQLQFKTGLKAALQVQLDLLEDDSVLNPSLLAHSDMKNKFLDSENQTPSEILEKDQSGIDPLVESKIETESNPSKEPSNFLKAKDRNSQQNLKKEALEINSLRESLNSLNKNFS